MAATVDQRHEWDFKSHGDDLPAELALWAGVVEQTITDSVAITIAPRERAAARAWLVNPSRSRDTILEVVGVDLDWWAERAVPRLKQLWAAADDLPQVRSGRRRLDLVRGIVEQQAAA